ncbi:MAG: methylated-DNA--[protein]-cysteine S-methyltransferase [Opitutales bacterium]
MHQALNESGNHTLRYGRHETPFGDCLIGLCQGRIAWLSFDNGSAQLEDSIHWPYGRMEESSAAGSEYARMLFGGDWSSLSDLPVHLLGTEFQLQVWEALRSIPPGETCSYAELAAVIGRAGACRAVGRAIGANPVAYLVPCHRVIRADGTLGGYRWGVQVKAALLSSEGIEASCARK